MIAPGGRYDRDVARDQRHHREVRELYGMVSNVDVLPAGYLVAISAPTDQIEYSSTYPIQAALALVSIIGLVGMTRVIRRSRTQAALARWARGFFGATLCLLAVLPLVWLGLSAYPNLGLVIIFGFVVVAADAAAVLTFLAGCACSCIALTRTAV